MLKLKLKFICFFLCLYCACGLDLPEGSKCTANGKKGRCVHYKRCLSVLQDRKDGKEPEICSYIEENPIICCTDCELVEDIEKIVIDPQVGLLVKDGSKAWDYCLDSYKNLPYDCKKGLSYIFQKEWDEASQCHQIKLNTVGASDEDTAKKETFPHMALLGYGDDEEDLQWLCGGSLISDRYILTAAQCTSGAFLGPVSYAALGISNWSDPEELWQKYKIQSIIRHPGYKVRSKYNDIALLKTETSVQFSVDVLPACVDSRGMPWGEQDWATVIEWGIQMDRSKKNDTLHEIVIQKYTPEECLEVYPPQRHLPEGYNHTTQMCYGDRSGHKDTCPGDGGSPLQVKNMSCMYTVIGVSSLRRGCSDVAYPDVYTRVEHYLDWIEDNVWP